MLMFATAVLSVIIGNAAWTLLTLKLHRVTAPTPAVPVFFVCDLEVP